MYDLSQYQVAVFDCDGVILDSNRVKSDAFALALESERTDLVSEFVRYHQEFGGVSRYVKFEHFFKNIKKVQNYDEDLKKALHRYAQLSKQGLLTCEVIPGVVDTLEYFRSQGVPCIVASGGDEQEVNDVLKTRDLAQYFVKIMGSPKTKEDNLNVARADGLLQGKGVYFGDARSDYNAATQFDLDFVYISGVSEWYQGKDFCMQESLPVYEDFSHF
ncbi:HAD family hydrolase [Vibrio sp. 16]|uniref:HAD family hydrolase n=1 Tax=Vibrio sp. 16 TaxID=391586 RepID=UPI002FF3846A